MKNITWLLWKFSYLSGIKRI